MPASFFNQYRHLEGQHSFLSASQGSWINYDDDKLIERWKTQKAAQHGTRLHEYAKESILLGQKLPDTNQTLNRYINDAISFGMEPEVMLLVSINCFGTADAIKFDESQMKLRIHDLKTGELKASFAQLLIYVAMFCLEYDYNVAELDIELRIYQHDTVYIEDNPDIVEITRIMSRIMSADRIVERLKAGEIL